MDIHMKYGQTTLACTYSHNSKYTTHKCIQGSLKTRFTNCDTTSIWAFSLPVLHTMRKLVKNV